MYAVERVEEIREYAEKKIFFCDTCDVKVSNYQSFKIHLNGKKHKARSQQKQKFRCDVCDIDLNGELQLQVHLKGKKHNYNLRGKTRASPVSIWVFIYLCVPILFDLQFLTVPNAPVFVFILKLFLRLVIFLFKSICYFKWLGYLLVLLWVFKPK